MSTKRSFFKKLTGAISPDEDDSNEQSLTPAKDWNDSDDVDGELTVDVYETPNHIVVKTIVAGVKKEDLDVALSRDMVSIKGKRESEHNVGDGDYFHKELYWGSFSRTILLPQEVDIEKAEAYENQGLLTIKLPKIDKERQTKLKIKSL